MLFFLLTFYSRADLSGYQILALRCAIVNFLVFLT
jgi:hypothetical protein